MRWRKKPLNPLVARGEGLIEADADDGMVGLHIANGRCYGFNPTATSIWRLLATPMRFNDLCAALAAEFDADPATLAADVRAMLDDLAGERLIVLS